MNMKRIFLITLCALLLLPATLFAEAWPKVMAVLTGWEGPRQILLRTDLEDPLASMDVQDLLELLLEQGYVVVPGAREDRPAEGLILDLRTSAGGAVLALSRAGDGAILAFERGGAEQLAVRQPPSPAPAPEAQGPVSSPASPASVPDERADFPAGPLELPDQPRRIAFLGASGEGGVELALFSDEALTKVSVGGKGLLARSIRPTPAPAGRALHLDTGDLDGDGTPEVAAVWAEDRRGIYEGTESKIHGRIFRGESLDPLGQDLEGYLRIVGGRALLQKKGAYTIFSGPVRPLVHENGAFNVNDRAVRWAHRDLFAATPVSAEEALAWNERGNLALVSLETGKTLPGGVLLEDLGEFAGPEVAVRLAIPEYRSGFSKEDRINEVFLPLPRRMAQGRDGAIHTVLRGRNEGLPLLGKPSGSDALVRIVRAEGGLRLERPFAGVDAFILDFALVDSPAGSQGAVLLLNEKADGSGQAYLLFQSASGR